MAAMLRLPMSTNATALATTTRCLFITIFFLNAPECVFEANAGPVDPGDLLSEGTTLSAADIGQCHTLDPATPMLSYQFFVNGNPSGCNIFIYNSADCPSTGTKVAVQANQGKCMEATSLMGVKSYKLVCPT